jgi:hypothetical protein
MLGQVLPQHLVHRGGVAENGRNIGVEQNQVRTFTVCGSVFASHAPGEIVFIPHFVSIVRLAHTFRLACVATPLIRLPSESLDYSQEPYDGSEW